MGVSTDESRPRGTAPAATTTSRCSSHDASRSAAIVPVATSARRSSAWAEAFTAVQNRTRVLYVDDMRTRCGESDAIVGRSVDKRLDRDTSARPHLGPTAIERIGQAEPLLHYLAAAPA